MRDRAVVSEVVDLHNKPYRIKRGGRPGFTENEWLGMRGYPHMLHLGSPQRTIRYRVDDWWHAGPISDERIDPAFLDEPWIRVRDLFAFIDHGTDCVGAVEVHAYQGATGLIEEWIFEILDGYSGYSVELGNVISKCWPDDPAIVFDYGDVVDLMHVWAAEPRFLNGLNDVLFDTFIPALTERYSILISKAYPLEYEHKLSEGDPALFGMLKRQRAMARLAKSKLGMNPLPGKFGNDGWLWRPNPYVADCIGKPEGL